VESVKKEITFLARKVFQTEDKTVHMTSNFLSTSNLFTHVKNHYTSAKTLWH